MNDEQRPATKSKRIHWMDNLRTVIIALVVLYHVGGVYEAGNLWGWFWIVDDPATISWVGIVGIVFDIFMMPTIFFISGYLTPPSLRKGSGWQFLRGKIARLMIPWAIAVLTLIPLYKVIFLYSRGLPQEHWSTYFHITNPNSQNWLWFLPLLFAFNVLYLLLSEAKVRFPDVSFAAAVAGAAVIGFAYSFVVGGLLGFRSWTLTPLIDFENERLLVYIMAYLLGALAFRKRIFERQPKSRTLYIVASSVAWLPVTGHIFARIFPFFYPEGFEITPVYRLIWWFTFHLSLPVMVYVMVESFRLYVDRTGKIWRELNGNSYGVYIIHVIVIGVFGTLLLNVGLPPVVKYLFLIVLTYAGTNLVVSIYRALRRVLITNRATASPPAAGPG